MANMQTGFGAAFDRAAAITLKEVGSSAVTSTTTETPVSVNSLNNAYWDNNEASFEGASIVVEVTALDNGNSDETYTVSFEADSSLDFASTTGPQNFIAGFQEDATGGPSYVDLTTELADNTANDVGVFPAGAAVDDAFYFGLDRPFGALNLNVGTVGTGTYTVAWEYWNGAWTALSETDNTTGFKTAGANTVTFTKPNDWAPTTINGKSYYYVRAIRDAGTVTADPLLTSGQADDVDGLAVASIILDRDSGVGVYSMPIDGGIISQIKPAATHLRAKASLGGTSPSLTYHAYFYSPVH